MSFPKLPAIERLVEKIQETAVAPLTEMRIICVQHLLETTGSLLEAFVRLGSRPENIHVLGKLYSTSPSIENRLSELFDVVRWQGDIRQGGFSIAIRQNVERLWARVESQLTSGDRALLVLDDGGRCRQFMPVSLSSKRVIAVEQTTSGLRYSNDRIPTVEVAGSAAKHVMEPPAVTASIMRFVVPQLESDPRKAIGVVGLGTVGEDLARRLSDEGRRVNVYDKKTTFCDRLTGVQWCSSLRELFESSTCVLGCTGEDLLEDADWLADLEGDRLLASCSSEDIEFRSLLQRASSSAHNDPLGPIEVRLQYGSMKILRGGFPANFTGTKNSGPITLIQVTRALLLAGVFQAARLASSAAALPARIMLDPELQITVGRAFLTPHRKRLLGPRARCVLDHDWVAANSTGVHFMDELASGNAFRKQLTEG